MDFKNIVTIGSKTKCGELLQWWFPIFES